MRKQIRGLTQASTNAEDGISTVQTAEGALAEVEDMLQRMNELAVKASNGTNSVSDRDAIQDEIDQLVTEIDRVAETTKFNEIYVLKGDKFKDQATNKIDYQYFGTDTTNTTSDSVDITSTELYYMDPTDQSVKTVAAGTLISDLNTGYNYYTANEAVTVGEAFTTDAVTTATVISVSGIYKKDSNGDFYELTIGTVYSGNATDFYTISDADGDNIFTAVAETQTNGFVSTGVFVSSGSTLYDTTGKAYESGTFITLGTQIASADTGKWFVGFADGRFDTANAVNLADYTTQTFTTEVVTISGQLMDKDGNEIAANGLYKYFDDEGNYTGELYTSADATVALTTGEVLKYVDTSARYTTGALKLTFHVGADATENNQISVEIDAMDATALGLRDSEGNALSVAGADDTNARNAIETIAAAIARVSEQRSALGAAQNRLEHTINNLDNIVENTTSAESTIRDTDMAKEMVKFSNLNILAQAGTSMLAQANQSSQNILSILG